MSTQPDRLQEFYEFTRLFKHNSLNNELISLLHLFQLSINDENLELGEKEKELVDILDFVNSYKKPDNFARILQIIGSAVEDLTKSENPANMAQLIRFFIATNDSKYQLLSNQLIIRLFDKELFNEGGLIEELNALRSEVKEAFADDKQFSTLFLSESHLSKITSNIQSLPPEKLSIVIKELISSIRALDNQSNVYEDAHFQQFVKEVVLAANVPQLNQLEWLLTPFIDKPLAVASICIHISNILENMSEDREESMKTFARFLSDRKAEYRFSIINTMKQSSTTWQILEEEWKYAIAKQRDKVAAHASYSQQVLQDNSEFSQHYLPLFSAELWELLSNSKKQQQAQAIAWVLEKQTESFSTELVKAVFQTANESVDFQ